MNHLPTLPLLEALRPPPGWRTDRAILSAYSAEPRVLVSLLLALTGRDDDSGDGSRVALARTLDELRGRVAFVLQRGRIAAPNAAPRVLALLDRFVREAPWDEGGPADASGRSWHAKLALVRLVASEDGTAPPQWRFWLGSRNFTLDTSWDIALSLETVQPGSSGGQTLDGIEQVAARLAEHADETARWQPLVSELAQTRWNVPRGLTLRRVALMLPGDTDRGFPPPPPKVRRLLAVAPFLDGGTVRRLHSWTDQTRMLLSTVPELGRLSTQRARPLKGFELLALPGTREENEAPPDEDSAPLDATLDSRGLHAKLLWTEHAGGATLWLGSPNLTQRAWTRNAEAFAEIGVRLRGGAQAAKSLHEGLETFRNMARPVDPEDLEDETPEDDDREALEAARCQVAARLCARQRHDAKGTTIIEALERPPHPEDPRISLIVGRLGGAMVRWARDAINVALPETDASADADLISLRISLNDQSLSWTQLAPFDPPLPPTRDAAILREYVGALGVLSWIRDVLDDTIDSDGGGPWDKKPPRRPRTPRPGAPTTTDVPTVEQVLRAWIRDPARLDSVDRILRTVATSPASAEDDAEARRHLEAFARSWKTLRAGLIGEARRVR